MSERVPDVLNSSLANLNMVLHAPGTILGAAWIEATRGDFTFYVQGMTPGVVRVMQALDAERLAVARAFGHELPALGAEMQRYGTVEASVTDTTDLVSAISGGKANQRIKAPDSFPTATISKTLVTVCCLSSNWPPSPVFLFQRQARSCNWASHSPAPTIVKAAARPRQWVSPA